MSKTFCNATHKILGKFLWKVKTQNIQTCHGMYFSVTFLIADSEESITYFRFKFNVALNHTRTCPWLGVRAENSETFLLLFWHISIIAPRTSQQYCALWQKACSKHCIFAKWHCTVCRVSHWYLCHIKWLQIGKQTICWKKRCICSSRLLIFHCLKSCLKTFYIWYCNS